MAAGAADAASFVCRHAHSLVGGLVDGRIPVRAYVCVCVASFSREMQQFQQTKLGSILIGRHPPPIHLDCILKKEEKKKRARTTAALGQNNNQKLGAIKSSLGTQTNGGASVSIAS